MPTPQPFAWRLAEAFPALLDAGALIAAERAECRLLMLETLALARQSRITDILYRRFPKISNEYWAIGNFVLVGDALRTAYFSTSSGTRLTLEDVQAPAEVVAEHPDSVPEALASFQGKRGPVVDKFTKVANGSAEWYGHLISHKKVSAREFAMNRVDVERCAACRQRP